MLKGDSKSNSCFYISVPFQVPKNEFDSMFSVCSSAYVLQSKHCDSLRYGLAPKC